MPSTETQSCCFIKIRTYLEEAAVIAYIKTVVFVFNNVMTNHYVRGEHSAVCDHPTCNYNTT